jgi:hypothetical protein
VVDVLVPAQAVLDPAVRLDLDVLDRVDGRARGRPMLGAGRDAGAGQRERQASADGDELVRSHVL